MFGFSEKKNHPPTVVQGRGRWWMEPLPGVFDMVVALLEACDVTNNGRHLGFYKKYEIWLNCEKL